MEVERDYSDYLFLSITWKWNYIPPPTPKGPKTVGKGIGPGRTGPDMRRVKSAPTIELVTIAPGKPFQFDGTTHNGSALFAVPKSALEECHGWKSLARSLRKLAKDAENDSIPGAKLHPYRSYSELPLHDSRSVVVLRYLFQNAPGGGVEFMTDRDPSLYVVDPRGDEGPRHETLADGRGRRGRDPWSNPPGTVGHEPKPSSGPDDWGALEGLVGTSGNSSVSSSQTTPQPHHPTTHDAIFLPLPAGRGLVDCINH